MEFGVHIDRKRRFLAAAAGMAAFLLGMWCGFIPGTVLAYHPAPAVVKGDAVRVRSAPVSGNPIATLTAGTGITIIEEESGTDGYIWYRIQFSEAGETKTGYVRSDLVALGEAADKENTEEKEYKEALKAAGFPGSYCSSLWKLHRKYPNWQFVPVQTGLEWDKAVAAESAAGKNLVESTANDARKSTDASAYDWAANRWYGYDGADWVCASSDFIAYCMDPRNYLTEEYIFQFETLEYAGYQSADGVKNILAGSFMSGKYTDTDKSKRSYVKTFLEIGKSLSVSPYHLASRCLQEQGKKGTSPLISGTDTKYKGYYNYFNIGAYTTSTASTIENGLMTAKNKGWDSIYESIAGGSAIVADKYISRGQNTIYFEKFNVVYQKSLYSHQYMTNVMAAISEGSSLGKAYTDKNQAFVFRIPVYLNMPEKAVSFTDTGNPNNWLSRITIDGYGLTPGFQGSVTSYSLVVPEAVTSINVKAAAVAPKSVITGSGTYDLSHGSNTITITCTSQSGAARDYTIQVARTGSAASVSDKKITFAPGIEVISAYPIKNYVTAVEAGTDTSAFLMNIQTAGCKAQLLNQDGTVHSGLVATGNILAISAEGMATKKYEVVVSGDINGDGKISNADQVLLQKHILGIEKQKGCHKKAANVSGDGGITNKDLVLLQKHILGIAGIGE